MRGAYKVIAHLIALGVLAQAAFIALGVFLLGQYIDDGHTVTKASFEDDAPALNGGLELHFFNGTLILPLLALIFFIVSFFAKVPGGVKWAGFTLLAIVVQVVLGMTAHGLPALGVLHGINAFVVFGLALYSGRVVASQRAVTSETTSPAAASV